MSDWHLYISLLCLDVMFCVLFFVFKTKPDKCVHLFDIGRYKAKCMKCGYEVYK